MGPPLPNELSSFLDAYAYPAAIVTAGDLTFENARFAALRIAHAPLLRTLLAAADAAAPRAETPLASAFAPPLAWILTHQRVAERGLSVVRTVLLTQHAPTEAEESASTEGSTSTEGPTGAEGHTRAPLAAAPIPRTLSPDRSWQGDGRFKAIATSGGELGDLIRAYDWQHTSLGPINTWCANLVSAVGMMLSSPLFTSLMWGPDLVLLYNTPYVALTGPGKHPGVLGQPSQAVWPEVWDVVGAPMRAALLKGKVSHFEDLLVLLERREADGAVFYEEFYVTWTCLPIFHPSGAVGGVYNTLYDVTARVVSERRMVAMRDLAMRLSIARTFTQLLVDSCEVLSQLDLDLPYVAAYRVQHADSSDPLRSVTFVLQETVGIPFDAPAAPARVVGDGAGAGAGDAPWDLGLLRGAHNDIVLFDSVQQHLLAGLAPRGHAEAHPRAAAALPIVQGEELVGCLVVYISGARPVTPALRTFLVLLAREMSTSASVVAAYEDEMQRLEDMAALDRAKTGFFTNISHELRTPLTLILGPVAELHNAGNLTPRQLADLDIVERNARRLLRLVNSIMDFATAEAGRLAASYQRTHIGPYTLDLASSFRSAAEMAGLEFTVESTLPGNFVVWIDREKYENIFYNLLSNAIKYTEKGFVRVSASLETNHFVLRVADSGFGIPKAEVQSIWDKFHRVASTQGRSIEGAGIGLALTFELVKLHKGDVHVESEPGQGSTFRVRFPIGNTHLPLDSLVDEDPADFASPALDGGAHMTDEVQQWQRSDEASGGSESTHSSELVWQPLVFGGGRARAHIIVADDNADMRQYVSGLLGRYCDVTQCTNGQHAWDELREQGEKYDLVLADDMMPAMTGTELLEALRANTALKSLPFIMISAKAGDEARMDTLAKGADDYLAKPFRARELLLRVHAQLQSTSVRIDLEQRVDEHSRHLEESQKSFITLCERLQVGIHRSDMQGSLTWCNRKWMDTLGLKEDAWDRWGEIVFPDDQAMALEHDWEAIRSGQGYVDPVELRIKDAQEEGRWLDIIYDLQPEFTSDSREQISGWIGVWTDVSALRRLQRKHVEVEREHAQQADRSRQQQEQFIDITCHELRNPLNAIYHSAALAGESLTRVQTLISDLRATPVPETDAKIRDSIDTLQDSIDTELREDIDSVNTILLCARHQKRITDDVLNVSKLSAGLITLVERDFSPFVEVKNTVRMFRDEVSARGLSLHFDKDDSMDTLKVDRVSGDGGRFVQIVVNLLSNAIKFTETASRHDIRVRLGAAPVQKGRVPAWFEMQQDDLLPMCRDVPPEAKADDLYIYVAVADSGHGMTPEEQDRVFQRFTQASPRTYGEFGGHGLGLFVSKMLVELHGGRIQLQSTQGAGTVLRFFIRVQRAMTTSPPAKIEFIEFPLRGVLSASSNGVGEYDSVLTPRKMRVLVVEDNMINQRVLVKLLTILDCETETRKDGQECVDLLCALATPERASEPRFDLILMDLEMPVLGGLDATHRIRELEESGAFGAYSVPIVAVSGNARDEWTKRAQHSGMDGFIRKPYSKEELRNVLNRWRRPRRRTE